MPPSHFLQFIGGLAFFFFGLYTLHEGLNFFAGDRLKNLVARSTAGPLRSLFTGIIATFFLQSSTASTVMIVGLVGSTLLTLKQAMAVFLGAGVGTTFVVLLISVKGILQYGLLIIIIGLLVRNYARRHVVKNIGLMTFGLGLVFFGMTVMGDATIPLQTNLLVPQIFQFMRDYPLTNFIIAAVLTALIHSSSAVLGILISLAHAGTISFVDAIPLILGANVGTCFTAIMVNFKANTDAKRAAWSNLFLRGSSVLLIYPIIKLFTEWMPGLGAIILNTLLPEGITVAMGISFFHFVFNIAVVLFFLPLLSLGERVMWFFFPPQPDDQQIFGPLYLDKSALSTPTLAFAQAGRELIRMGEIVQNMFKKSHTLFEKYDLEIVDQIKESDHQVDTLYKAIKFYLAKLALHQMEEEDANQGIHLMTAVNDLETIGDTIDRHIVRLAHKKENKGAEFSEKGWDEICDMHTMTAEMVDLALATLSSASREIALKMQTHLNYITEKQNQLKMSHLKRLHEGLRESIDTSTIHLELMTLYYRISLMLVNMVQHYLPEEAGFERKEEDEGE